jgi:hypothetical protein
VIFEPQRHEAHEGARRIESSYELQLFNNFLLKFQTMMFCKMSVNTALSFQIKPPLITSNYYYQLAATME